MIYSDLHCDTVTRCFEKNESLVDATGHINKFKSKQLDEHRQCFALFVPDSKRGSTAFSYLEKLVDFYEREKKKLEGTNIIPVLTVENAAALGGDADNVFYLSQKQVKMLTLTWNGENELAFGAACDEGGLKNFGKRVITKMEREGIAVDVSHLNKESFYDVAAFTASPLIASHSNCSSLLCHKRNLDDEQIKLIIESGGLIGLCFHSPFLSINGMSNFEMLYRNIFHVLSLGGENSLCFGSDFDGGNPVCELSSLQKVKNLHGYLKGRGLGEKLLEKIFYKNAERIFPVRNEGVFE